MRGHVCKLPAENAVVPIEHTNNPHTTGSHIVTVTIAVHAHTIPLSVLHPLVFSLLFSLLLFNSIPPKRSSSCF